MREAGEADQGTRVIQAAAGRRRSREERAAVSGRRQTGTMEEAAEEGSEHEGASPGNVSTIGEGARARSAEGGASVSIYHSWGVCTGSYIYNSLTGGSRVVVFF